MENVVVRWHAENMLMQRRSKAQARKDFAEGKTVYLLPCKCSFNGIWVHPYSFNPQDVDEDFDYCVRFFEYFNCNSELGRYAHFYIQI